MPAYDWPIDTENLPVMRIVTPRNVEMCGVFGMSFAYYSLKERLPVILTKVIDNVSRNQVSIMASNGVGPDKVTGLISHVSKLKSDLVRNKNYDEFTEDSDEADKWNDWIEGLENAKYFTNTWVWTECYVYRKLREGCVLNNMPNFDPFSEQKDESFNTSLEAICVVADKVVGMLEKSEKDKRKVDFITLLKLSLWSNKCDLSLSMGEQVNLQPSEKPPEKAAEPAAGGKGKDKAPRPSQSQPALPKAPGFIDPFQMIIDFKDKLLVDDSGKIADQVVAKADNIRKAIEAEPPPPPPPPPEPVEGEEAAPPPEEPKIPCPAKMTVGQAVMFDIVCDNAGYELFTDLCLANFLVAQKIVQKVRFHVKQVPWFVSDVTRRDFKHVIDACAGATYSKELPAEPKEPKPEGEGEAEAEEPRRLGADSLRTLGAQWQQFLEDGTFLVLSDPYWTYPHVYKDMKKYDYNLYRKLQLACAILFKGDLNYRKLLGERNCNPIQGFDPSLQGFNPAPVIALRTVKADLICGLPRGKWEALNKIDEKWMEKGDYGVIQFSPKGEALKVSDRPCADYGDTCRGVTCPVHRDM